MEDAQPVIADVKSEDTPVAPVQATPDLATDKGDQMVPKQRLDQVIQQRKDALAVVKGVADELILDVPEAYRDLIPQMDSAAQIIWIRKAQKSGIFTKEVQSLDTERPAGKKVVDYSKMKPTTMISAGYNK